MKSKLTRAKGLHSLDRRILLIGLASLAAPGPSLAQSFRPGPALPSSVTQSFAAGHDRPLFKLPQSSPLGAMLRDFCVSPQENEVAVFGPNEDDLTFVDLATAKPLWQGKVPGKASATAHRTVTYSSDGRYLFWAAPVRDGYGLIQFDLVKRVVVKTFALGKKPILALAYIDDTVFLITSSYQVLEIALASGDVSRLPVSLQLAVFPRR